MSVMSWTARMYRDEHDLVAMRALVAANYAAGSVKDHVGDLTWGVYQNTVYSGPMNLDTETGQG